MIEQRILICKVTDEYRLESILKMNGYRVRKDSRDVWEVTKIAVTPHQDWPAYDSMLKAEPVS